MNDYMKKRQCREKLREEFEAWVAKNYAAALKFSDCVARYDDGVYILENIQNMWRGWCSHAESLKDKSE